MRVLIVTLFATVLLGQQKKDPPRPFIPPDLTLYVSGTVLGTVLVKDEGCARDYLRMLQMEGVEQRKTIVDLDRYGCVETLSGLYMARVLTTKRIDQGPMSEQFDEVLLIQQLEVSAEGRVTRAPLSRPSKRGWYFTAK